MLTLTGSPLSLTPFLIFLLLLLILLLLILLFFLTSFPSHHLFLSPLKLLPLLLLLLIFPFTTLFLAITFLFLALFFILSLGFPPALPTDLMACMLLGIQLEEITYLLGWTTATACLRANGQAPGAYPHQSPFGTGWVSLWGPQVTWDPSCSMSKYEQ